MLCLTLHHPWPFFIAVAGKRIENRTWLPAEDEITPGTWFAFHGGRPPEGPTAERRLLHQTDLVNANLELGLSPEQTTLEAVLRYSGVFAVCRYGGHVEASADRWFDDANEGNLGWLLEKLVLLPQPVPCRGYQRLWTLPRDVLARVQDQFWEATAQAREGI